MNRKPVYSAWGGGAKFFNSLHECSSELNYEVVDDPIAADVILVVGYDKGDTGMNFLDCLHCARSMKKKIVVRINENDARKGTTGVDDQVKMMVTYADGTVFVSHWLKNYFEQKWKSEPEFFRVKQRLENSTVIINGVDESIFRPREKIQNEKINIVTAHWSDNYLKGQDITEFLDNFVKVNEEFSYTFIGRTKAILQNSKLVPPLETLELGKSLSKYQLSVNGTRFDPGPNSVIESISCGVPTYVHIDGGGAVEFAGKDHCYETKNELEKLLLAKKYISNLNIFSSWKDTISLYFEYIK
jgi:glycosyltransferase involved in cell wall biosynthesis